MKIHPQQRKIAQTWYLFISYFSYKSKWYIFYCNGLHSMERRSKQEKKSTKLKRIASSMQWCKGRNCYFFPPFTFSFFFLWYNLCTSILSTQHTYENKVNWLNSMFWRRKLLKKIFKRFFFSCYLLWGLEVPLLDELSVAGQEMIEI